MEPLRLVIDTNVLIAGLRSRRGASHALLRRIDDRRLAIFVSVALFLEYEATSKRLAPELGLTHNDIDVVLNYVAYSARAQPVYYIWRPTLRDTDDDLVLEVAVAAGCEGIVTFNQADFKGCERFGLRTMTPADVLRELGGMT
jgi:putative PIN family toxin of toxin-antitoxin system